MTDWYNNLSKPAKYAILAGAGICAGSAALFLYSRRTELFETSDSVFSTPEKLQIPVPVVIDSTPEKLQIPVPVPVVVVDVDSDISDEAFVTPCASTEANNTKCCAEEGRKIVAKEPVESISIDDGFEQKPSRKVLLLGLENSGKSSLLSQLSKEGTNCIEYEPTKGFNVVCISFENIDLSIWEIGGAPEYRTYWKNFCSTTDVILFVLDSTDTQKFVEARQYFYTIMDELGDEIDFRVIATKADKENSASIKELEEALGLEGVSFDILKIAVEAGGAGKNIGVEDVQNYCLHD